ncbi:MAG: hypothetical protein J0L73_28445 [Verrucomicrobia bacterium]|nr:hypothetical protein [Verrucomicrobiota bacterium]
MSGLDDMTEKKLHDSTEDHGFSIVEASPPTPFSEFPFRGPDLEMDYRQPGFAFVATKPNEFAVQWPSFVQGVECEIPAKFKAPDGYHFGVKVVVLRKFKSKAVEVTPPSEPMTRKYASGPYQIQSVEFVVAKNLPEVSPNEPIAYDGNYLNSTDETIFGTKFSDTEVIVADLGVVTEGKLVRSIDEGNLFFSRFSRFQITVLVTQP